MNSDFDIQEVMKVQDTRKFKTLLLCNFDFNNPSSWTEMIDRCPQLAQGSMDMESRYTSNLLELVPRLNDVPKKIIDSFSFDDWMSMQDEYGAIPFFATYFHYQYEALPEKLFGELNQNHYFSKAILEGAPPVRVDCFIRLARSRPSALDHIPDESVAQLGHKDWMQYVAYDYRIIDLFLMHNKDRLPKDLWQNLAMNDYTTCRFKGAKPLIEMIAITGNLMNVFDLKNWNNYEHFLKCSALAMPYIDNSNLKIKSKARFIKERQKALLMYTRQKPPHKKFSLG